VREINAEKMKERLLLEKKAILAKLASNDLSVDDTDTPDPVDLAARNYSKNVTLAVSENESRQLKLIEEALQRIDDEEYGLCLNCGKPIQSKRLEVIPWARYCLNCQELVEQGLIEEEE